MAAKNDITGDSIRTKHSNLRAYAAGWDRIFGKKATRSRPSQKRGVGKPTAKACKNNSGIV